MGDGDAFNQLSSLAQAKWLQQPPSRASGSSYTHQQFGNEAVIGRSGARRVLRIGQHTTVELSTGRKASIYPGDEIVLCYGNRYAPDQFEALVPPDLGIANLAAAGGIASRVVLQHDKWLKLQR